jgi:hypothetical protein
MMVGHATGRSKRYHQKLTSEMVYLLYIILLKPIIQAVHLFSLLVLQREGGRQRERGGGGVTTHKYITVSYMMLAQNKKRLPNRKKRRSAKALIRASMASSVEL